MATETIYKYRPPDRVVDLRTRTIKLTPPGTFNDPFEALPAVSGAWSEATIEALANETHRLAAADGVVLPHDEVIADFAQQNRLAQEVGQGWIASLANEMFGVVSFAAARDNVLMWGHYAASHSGFVIGFNAAHQWFQRAEHAEDPVNRLIDVRYSAERPAVFLDGARLEGPDGAARWAAAVLGTKSSLWEYECERRLVLSLGMADRVEERENSPLYLLSVPPEVVTEVVFGWRMDYDRRSALCEILDDPDYRHVRRFRASISPDRYEMILTPS